VRYRLNAHSTVVKFDCVNDNKYLYIYYNYIEFLYSMLFKLNRLRKNSSFFLKKILNMHNKTFKNQRNIPNINIYQTFYEICKIYILDFKCLNLL